MLGRSRQRGKLVLSAQSLCPDILGVLNLSQPFGLGADPWRSTFARISASVGSASITAQRSNVVMTSGSRDSSRNVFVSDHAILVE